MPWYQGQLPRVREGGKVLSFAYQFETDEYDSLKYLHVWRKGFLGYAEDVELVVQSDTNEIRMDHCKVKSRALIEALIGFTSQNYEQLYTVSLLSWVNRLARVIDSRYPDY